MMLSTDRDQAGGGCGSTGQESGDGLKEKVELTEQNQITWLA